jgi:acyl-CoA synthetase (AMP-forming)/AMP-acid ligase II
MTQIGHLGYLIHDAVKLYPNRVALIQDDVQVTFRELDERADRTAGVVQAAGIQPGDRVGLFWTNEYHYVEALLGALRSGAVVVPMNIKLGDDSLDHVVRDSGMRLILSEPSLRDRASRLVMAPGESGLVLTSDAWQAAGPHFIPPPSDPDDICFQPYTSGSTGKPKGVLLSHRGQIWCADTVRKWKFLDETDRAIVSAPLYHKNAGVALKVCLTAGASVVILREFDPVATLAAVDRYQCTFFGGVPLMLRAILEQARAMPKLELGSLRFATVGSADVPEELISSFEQQFGVPLLNGYGLTEGGPDVFIEPRFGIRKPGSLGPPLPGCEVRLADLQDSSRDVDPEVVGELWVRNPGVAVGYNNLPALTAERIRDGWLATGDLMTRDADNYYSYVSRRDDMINVGGENVYPREVEATLLSHPEVLDCAVVAVPHPTKGAAPAAAVVLNPGAQVDEDGLKAWCIDNAAAYAHPRRVLVVEALPVGSTGKTDRGEIRRLLLEEERVGRK